MKETTNSPIASVVVPAYCAEKYIDRCINSILNQTESNIELWLIDDGSPDQCGNICDIYAQRDPRVHVIHKENAGVSAARNDGIRCASGKYIAFIDADDYIEPDTIASLVCLAEQVKAEIVICGYYIEQACERKTANICCGDGNYDKTAIKQLFSKFFGRDYIGLSSMCNKLYLRSFLNLQKIQVDESLQRAEDFWFNFEAIMHSSCVSVISTPLYHYVQNTGSVMHCYRETQFDDWTRNRKRLLSIANEQGIQLKPSDFYYRYVYNSILFLRESVGQSNWQKIHEIMRNPFLRQAIKQTSGLPLHIRLIATCIKNGLYGFAGFLLKVWEIF